MRSAHYHAAGVSLLGTRQINQDRWLMVREKQAALLVVCDGLGGHPKGEKAADIVTNLCKRLYQEAPKPIDNPPNFFFRCVREAHEIINLYGNHQHPPIRPRTTVVMALVQDGRVTWAHIGDSRLYLLHQGKILVNTTDHARKTKRKGSNDQIVEKMAMTRSVGGSDNPPMAAIAPARDLKPGDTLLLCTDGFWNQLPPQRLCRAFQHEEIKDLAGELKKMADEATRGRKKSDNCTAIALQWLGPPEGPGLSINDPEVDKAVDQLSNLVDNYKKKLRIPDIIL